MKRKTLVPATIACGLLLNALAALAARPLQTDDAGVIERGGCEVEAVALRHAADGERATENSLQLGCGVGWQSQLALGWATTRSEGARESGLSVSGKTGLWRAGDDPDGEAAALALSWEFLEARMPTGSWRHVGTGLNLLASVPLPDDVTLHANLGHARNELTRQQSTPWGVGLEHAGWGEGLHWAPMAELFGDDRERPWWNLGGRLTTVPGKVFIDASYGRQFASHRPRLMTLGVKAAF